jgi:hypothetical protein
MGEGDSNLTNSLTNGPSSAASRGDRRDQERPSADWALTRLWTRAAQVKEAVLLISSAVAFLGSVGSLLWKAVIKAADPSEADWNLPKAARVLADQNLAWLAAVECGFILVLWVLVSSRRIPSGEDPLLPILVRAKVSSEALTEAIRDAHKFRQAYQGLLLSWMALYLLLWLAHARYGQFADDSPEHQRLHLATMAANVASAVSLAVCYLALGGHSRYAASARRERQPSEMATDKEWGPREKAPIAVGLAIVVIAFVTYSAPPGGVIRHFFTIHQVSEGFGFASGLANAIAMGLLAGRISSAALGGGPLMAMGLQLYAGIQPVFGIFLDEPLAEFLTIAVAIPLKVTMFWILSRALRDGSLVCLLCASRARQDQDLTIHRSVRAADVPLVQRERA